MQAQVQVAVRSFGVLLYFLVASDFQKDAPDMYCHDWDSVDSLGTHEL